MKKIIFLFLTLFVFIINTKALTNFYLGEKIPDINIKSNTTEVPNNNISLIKSDDKKLVYSLSPFYNLSTEGYDKYSVNEHIFNLIQNQLETINLAAYYGYNYKNHTDIKWYAITQYVIWKRAGISGIYFVDQNDNKITEYDDEINELETMISSYLSMPSFANKKYSFTTNSSYKIVDTKGVLSEFEILSSNISASINSNELSINTKKEGKYEITFIKKSPIKNPYYLYHKEGSQSLIYPGEISDVVFFVTIEVNGGSITINKKDSENINRRAATLEGSVYGIYNEKELIKAISTDKNGVAYIDNLPLGKYNIKEITNSNGYKLDENIYEINLTKNNKNIIINSFSEVIKGNLIIKKYYDNNLEDGALFEIYDINNNLVGAYKTSDGIINVKLEYGDYYITQVKSNYKYELIDKFNISIKEEKEYNKNLYSDKVIKKEDVLIVEVPNTKKYDYELFMPIIFITVGLILIFKSLKKTTH